MMYEVAERILDEFPRQDSERNIEQLLRPVAAPSREYLQRCIDLLIEDGYLRRFYRVVAPSGRRLQDFYERSDVPDEMEDTGARREAGDLPIRFEVTDPNIWVIYGRSENISLWEDRNIPDDDEDGYADWPVDMECNLGISSKCLGEFSWSGGWISFYKDTEDNDIMLTLGEWIVGSKDEICVCPACAAVCAACFTALS